MDLYKSYKYLLNLSDTVPYKALVNLRQLVFEVTSNCNLRCKYCGYGELYNTRRFSKGENMSFIIAKNIIDYLFNLWNNNEVDYDHRQTFIGFYGGEPLLNIPFIKKVIGYIESLPVPKRRSFTYAMTTNGILLDRYMDYLVEKKFVLLISLDGDKYAHSYRIDSKGNNSFDKVFENTKQLQKKYPDFFATNVSFNAVLTDRGDTFNIKNFIYENFGKYPTVSEINESGVLEKQKDKFNEIFHSSDTDWTNPQNKEYTGKFIEISPQFKSLYNILMRLSENSFRSYNSLMAKEGETVYPTGTCFPFDRKLFLTVGGDILPCERINQKFSLGKVTEKGVNIDFKAIAKKYSLYYRKIWSLCKTCYAKPVCSQCFFYVDNLEKKPVCLGYKNKEEYDMYIHSRLNYLAENPEIYLKLMKETF